MSEAMDGIQKQVKALLKAQARVHAHMTFICPVALEKRDEAETKLVAMIKSAVDAPHIVPCPECVGSGRLDNGPDSCGMCDGCGMIRVGNTAAGAWRETADEEPPRDGTKFLAWWDADSEVRMISFDPKWTMFHDSKDNTFVCPKYWAPLNMPEDK